MYLKNGHGQSTWGGLSAWGLGKGITTPHHTKKHIVTEASQLTGCCEHGNEHSGSLKGGESVD
jgi:hypothetical protein